MFETKYHQEFEKDVSPSINHELHLQKLTKNSLSVFGEKRY